MKRSPVIAVDVIVFLNGCLWKAAGKCLDV